MVMTIKISFVIDNFAREVRSSEVAPSLSEFQEPLEGLALQETTRASSTHRRLANRLEPSIDRAVWRDTAAFPAVWTKEHQLPRDCTGEQSPGQTHSRTWPATHPILWIT
jgi:hypothetical protein